MNFALIGYGYWGPNLARNLKSIPGINLKYICDVDPDRGKNINFRYPGTGFVCDCEAIASDREIDAVLIATPVKTHYLLCKMMLENGKDVFVEKPLAYSTDHAQELVDLADKHEKILMIGHTFLYSPSVKEIKRIISSGELGEIYFISSSRVNLGKHQKDVSVLWDLAPHDLSMFHYWLESDPRWVSCNGNNYIIKDIPDVAFMHLNYPGDICVNLEIAWLAPSKLRRVAIIGSQKMLVYNDMETLEKVKIFDKGVDYKDPESFGEYQLSYRSGNIFSPYISSQEPLYLEVLDFYNSVKNRTQPVSNGRLGLNIVKIIEKAEQSLNSKGEQVKLG